MAAIAELYPCCRLYPSQKCFDYANHIGFKKKQQTQNLIKRALKHFECMLPLFSPAQLTSTDPKPATIKNTRKSLADHTRSNRKCMTNISNMVQKTLWMHLSEKFSCLSSDWHISTSRPAHLRFRHFCYDFNNPKSLTPPDCTAHASKSAFCSLHQPQFTLAQPEFFPRQTDGRMFSSGQVDAARGQSACSTHIQGTHACDDAITWTTGKSLRRVVLCVCLQFACLVIFS